MPTLPPLNWSWILLGALVFVATSVGGLAAASAVLVRLPADYFSESRPREFLTHAHPVLRWTGLVLKNIAGLALVGLGIVLSLPGVPGPGLLVMLLGITLVDFPGKRRMERWLIGRPGILGPVNRLRERHGKPPLVM